jgi:hypothetical protein
MLTFSMIDASTRRMLALGVAAWAAGTLSTADPSIQGDAASGADAVSSGESRGSPADPERFAGRSVTAIRIDGARKTRASVIPRPWLPISFA